METHSLHNGHLQVSVNAAGAELCSLKNAEGLELLWQADKTVWPRHAPVLFPIVGRLKNDSYVLNDKSYKLTQHGFARDHQFELKERGDSFLEFELTDNENTRAVYPFHFSLRIRYSLNENTLTIAYTVLNTEDETLPFSIGAHPGFSCKTKSGESLSDYQLEFKTEKLKARKLSNGLRSAEHYKVPLHDKTLQLNSALFDNDALVFENTQVEEVTLSSSSYSLRMICKGWPYFGVWTKKGADDFVCLEPWYGIADRADGNDNFYEKEGIHQLAPGSRFNSEFSVELLK